MKELENEVYECAGCAGQVSIVEAIWLKIDGKEPALNEAADPYCCRECFMKPTNSIKG